MHDTNMSELNPNAPSTQVVEWGGYDVIINGIPRAHIL